MLYEVQTYTLQPGTVSEFESRFAQRQSLREKYSKLGAFWHTEIGPLNQVVHVWPYEDLNQCAEVRAAVNKDQEIQKMPPDRDFIVAQESEVVIPVPFMHPLGSRDYGTGNLYEMRIYTYHPFSMAQVLERWAETIPYREKFSPLAACWYSEFGGLNKFTHIWVYKNMAERDRIREESRRSGGPWPPNTREWMIRQENKILLPAAFSPVK